MLSHDTIHSQTCTLAAEAPVELSSDGYPVIKMEGLLILDVRTRVVASALIPILIGATWAHAGNGWVFSNAGGGWEYPLFLIVVSVVVALQSAPARQTNEDLGAAGLERAA